MSRMHRARMGFGRGVTAGAGPWCVPSLIKNIQRGTITMNNVTTNTATITSVDIANSVIYYLGYTCSSGAGSQYNLVKMRIRLTNATTVTAFVNTGAASDHIVSWEVIEYYPGVIKSLQRGAITVTTATTNTATINPVNTLKTQVIYGGHDTNSTATAVDNEQGALLTLTNATTLTATQANSTDTINVQYQVVEWF